jgi:hypothetical protein
MAIKAGVNTVCGLRCQQHMALFVIRVAYSAGLKYNSTQPTVLLSWHGQTKYKG